MAPGVVITAIDNDGHRRAGTLSTPSGEYFLRLPAAGRYELRALRIGFHPSVISGVDVGADGVRTFDIMLAEQPVMLDQMQIEAKGTVA